MMCAIQCCSFTQELHVDIHYILQRSLNAYFEQSGGGTAGATSGSQMQTVTVTETSGPMKGNVPLCTLRIEACVERTCNDRT